MPVLRCFLNGFAAAGFYNSKTFITRMKTHGDVRTALHELAHALDDALFEPRRGALDMPRGPKGHWGYNGLKLSTAAQNELHTLGRNLYGKDEPPNGYLSEGFAEFGVLWLADREQARAKAPAFAKWFEGEVAAKHPKLAKAIDAASTLATAYYRQGAQSRAQGNIARLPSRTQNALAATKGQVTSFRKNWIEAAAAIEELADTAARLRGDKDGTLPTALDPFQSFKAYRLAADAIVEDWAENGMTDAGRNRTGVAPLQDAFKLVGKTQADAFVVYLWARRTVALYDDPKNGPRNSGLAIEDARHILETLGSPQFEKAAGIVYAWGEGVLDYVAEASPALAEAVKQIRAVDPGDYVPLKREFAELDRLYRASGGGSAARAQLTKRLRGSGRRIKHPVESMLAQAKDMVHKAHQRQVIDKVIHLARTVRGLGHLAVEVPVAQVPITQRPMAELLQKLEGALGSRGKLAKILEKRGQGDLLEEVVTFFAPAAEPKAGELPVLPVWEDGKNVCRDARTGSIMSFLPPSAPNSKFTTAPVTS